MFMCFLCPGLYGIYVDPQIETNSIRKRGFPIWEYSSLPAHFRTVITIWKRWSPYGKHSHMVIFTSIPKWAWTLFGNGLVTERSPFGNGDPFLYGDPHIEMGIRSICFPIWKRGFTLSIWGFVYPRFHMVIAMWKRGAVSLCSLYGNGDSPFPYGDLSIPVSIWWSPCGNGEPFHCAPYMETGISI